LSKASRQEVRRDGLLTFFGCRQPQRKPGRLADQYAKPSPFYQPSVYSGEDGVGHFWASKSAAVFPCEKPPRLSGRFHDCGERKIILEKLEGINKSKIARNPALGVPRKIG
jgi:hypothetical protein